MIDLDMGLILSGYLWLWLFGVVCWLVYGCAFCFWLGFNRLFWFGFVCCFRFGFHTLFDFLLFTCFICLNAVCTLSWLLIYVCWIRCVLSFWWFSDDLFCLFRDGFAFLFVLSFICSVLLNLDVFVGLLIGLPWVLYFVCSFDCYVFI